MRTGFSLKEAASILDIHERRVTQALDPTLTKIAKLWRADATKTMAAILDAVEKLPSNGRPTEQQLQALFEAELPKRLAELSGRTDRTTVAARP